MTYHFGRKIFRNLKRVIQLTSLVAKNLTKEEQKKAHQNIRKERAGWHNKNPKAPGPLLSEGVPGGSHTRFFLLNHPHRSRCLEK